MRETLRVRVAFADTDAMGVAWHGAHLRWFEQARVELLRGSELPYALLVERGLHLPVIEVRCRYRRAARFDDVLSVRCAARPLEGARLRIDYRIDRGGELVAEGRTEHVFTDGSGRVRRPPPEFVAVLERLASAPDPPR